MMSVATPSGPAGEGSVIARKYRLESLLGEGGMGSIWRAFNLQLDVPVAIKLLRADLSSAELGERLRVEARAAAKLVHPSIVRVFDIGETEWGDPFIVMELLHGESLGAMLERGALGAVNALQLLLPIAEALSLAHSRGVVHRDLKPDNIFIARDDGTVQPKLLDFGIAKVTSAVAAGSPTLTQSGTLLGSPDYMSPEQAQARSDIDVRSDVWSFCVVLYEMLAGQAPFRGDTCQAILQGVLQNEPPSLELVGVDRRLAALIARGMTKDRDARPASIFELGRELAAWLALQGVQEDATGSSLEAKWLGRSDDALLPPGVCTPRAQHEQATLVSVVNPSPRGNSEPSIELPLPRGKRWLPTAVVACAALAGCVAWASFGEFQTASEGASALSPSAPAPAPAAAAVVQLAPDAASPSTVIDLDALPAEELPAKAAKTRVPRAFAAKPTPPTRQAVLHAAPDTAASSLPRALPARNRDLLNPY